MIAPPASAPETGAAPLNLKQVAKRLGVHYMTAYRYVRQGLLPARREGTGWVVDPADVDAFTPPGTGSAGPGPVAPAPGHQPPADPNPGSRIAPSPSPSPSPDADPGSEAPGRSRVDWAARLRVQLLAGNEVGAWSVIDRALASGVTPQRCYLDLVAGTVATIGEDGAAGGASVADQYLATATAQRVVARLGTRFRRRGRSRGTVVFGAPRGEMHALPIAIVADLVRLANFTVLELGVDVPPEAFAVAAERADRLVTVGIGVTRIDHLDAAAAVVAAVRRAHPDVPIMAGGQALRNADVARVIGVDAWAPDGDAVVEVIEALAARRGSAPGAAVRVRRPAP